MKLTILVNGLLPCTRDLRDGKDGGSRVFVRVEKKNMELLEEIHTSDNNGRVEIEISDKYAGGAICIHIRHRWYKGTTVHDVIPDYGYFYTAKIQHDYTAWSESPSSDPEWDTEGEYLLASAELRQKIRHHRYANRGAKVLYYIFMFGVPLSGLMLGGIPGVVLGLAVSVVVEMLSPYSIGLKKFWK